MKSISSLLEQTQKTNRPKNISREFQFYGVFLAEELEDTKHYSLYIKLAKTYPRPLLEAALNFIKDYSSAKSKPKLFMWKLKQLRSEKEAKPSS